MPLNKPDRFKLYMSTEKNVVLRSKVVQCRKKPLPEGAGVGLHATGPNKETAKPASHVPPMPTVNPSRQAACGTAVADGAALALGQQGLSTGGVGLGSFGNRLGHAHSRGVGQQVPVKGRSYEQLVK
eukprot:1144125-Pelagomonas_calceolata.AAC.11